MNIRKRFYVTLLALIMLMASVVSVYADNEIEVVNEDAAVEEDTETALKEENSEESETSEYADVVDVPSAITMIKKSGMMVLAVSYNNMKEVGYKVGDVVNVTIKDYSVSMPFCYKDNDVDVNESVLVNEDGSVGLTINGGNFAESTGLFKKVKDESGKTGWEIKDGEELNKILVTISLLENDAYLDDYNIRNMDRSTERTDFDDDEQFANWRAVSGGSIKESLIFRGSSPINITNASRVAYVEQLEVNNGIKTVLNLADSEKEIDEHMDSSNVQYYASLVSAGSVACLNMDYDFKADVFKEKAAEGIRFMLEHDGPYLIHCTEGKDRTGFMCALIEALLDADRDEIVSDYMKTYVNYYDMDEDDEEYRYIEENQLRDIFEALYGREDYENSSLDLRSAAEIFLLNGGSTREEIRRFRKKTGTVDTSASADIAIDISGYDTNENGIMRIYDSDRVFYEYTGDKIIPGDHSLTIGGKTYKNGEDYELEVRRNTHAGILTEKFIFNESSGLPEKGISKLLYTVSIAPRCVTEDLVEIEMDENDDTRIKKIVDLDTGKKIRRKNYYFDDDSNRIIFKNDYAGEIDID
ncbi:MAG: tyrosine-protein phosphatase [Lachnospiraceae bacterium]|nr:tyrosine-protein phosphatase [Lachnospiraceae bacterium]